MSTAVKKRVLDLLAKDHQKYYDIARFFLDPAISKSEKELKSFNFLEKECAYEHDGMEEIPSDLDTLQKWVERQNTKQCANFQDYLARREAGGSPEFFNTLSKAYEFLYKSAPLKRVDGVWLYSFAQYWNDPAFRDFIQIFIEELGLGLECSNHVCVYENLLVSLGLHQFSMHLPDEYYHQAAIQLALAYAPSAFIPEIAGYNLGYEQLPLHLLMTNFELTELGIDAKYFNLHISIDNFESGHARMASEAVRKLSGRYKDQAEFIRKVRIGFWLTGRGKNSAQIIQSLNTEHAVVEIFKKKAAAGKYMHSSRCLFNSRPINEWLSDQTLVEEFLLELIQAGWIKRHDDPEKSRFWHLINDSGGKMYGVFSAAEKTFIYDWIAGSKAQQFKNTVNSELISNFMDLRHFSYVAENELQELKKQIQASGNLAYKVSKLIPYLAPHCHHQEIGLWSTRRIAEYLFPYLMPQPRSKASVL